jgi:O-methyltransferase
MTNAVPDRAFRLARLCPSRNSRSTQIGAIDELRASGNSRATESATRPDSLPLPESPSIIQREVQAENMTSLVPSDVSDRYLDLMKQCLTRYLFIDEELRPVGGTRWRAPVYDRISAVLRRFGLAFGRVGGNRHLRANGWDLPTHAETMVGLKRLDHVQQCVTDVLRTGIPGDLIEAGVWRGGTTIFMRAILAAHGDTTRRVWVADSFRGFPAPNSALYPADSYDFSIDCPWLDVGLEQVKANFAKYGLLDSQVEFLVGWFRDTLPVAPIERLAVIRLDGDLYESTMDSLTALYPKLSDGGYVIVDDYHAVDACRRAITDYRDAHGIVGEMQLIDPTGVYWQKRQSY